VGIWEQIKAEKLLQTLVLNYGFISAQVPQREDSSKEHVKHYYLSVEMHSCNHFSSV